MRGAAMKVLIISFLRRVQHLPETLLLIPRPTAEALYGRHYAQMKSPQDDVKHEPYTHIMSAYNADDHDHDKCFPLQRLHFINPRIPKGEGSR